MNYDRCAYCHRGLAEISAAIGRQITSAVGIRPVRVLHLGPFRITIERVVHVLCEFCMHEIPGLPTSDQLRRINDAAQRAADDAMSE